jgi:hypothetical protein
MPLKGLLVGACRLEEDVTDKGMFTNPFDPSAGTLLYTARSIKDFRNQFYGDYVKGKLRINAEYRRYYESNDVEVAGSLGTDTETDAHGLYIAGTCRIMKRLAVGSYLSRYTLIDSAAGALAMLFGEDSNTGLPPNHIYDKVITARVDLKQYWNVKVRVIS